MSELAIVVLAAGQGKRMKSEQLPKVLHSLAGRPMIQYVLDSAAALDPARLVVIVGHGGDQVAAALDGDLIFVEQRRRLGTGHAVMQAEAAAGDCQHILVLYGDMPLLQPATLRSLWACYRRGDSPLGMLILRSEETRGFGRVILNHEGRVQAIVEESECTTEQLAIHDLNAGVYCFTAEWLWRHLPQLPLHANRGDEGEYFLTDLVAEAVAQGFAIPYLIIDDPSEALGINTLQHLAEAETVLRRRREMGGEDKRADTH
jgi:bifunctional UDP-N-acetylglucosamine pyrophosphorylase/glucosamine-1-phosphate N-acetyltransferase